VRRGVGQAFVSVQKGLVALQFVVEDNSVNPTAALLDPGAFGLKEPILLSIVRPRGDSPSPRGTAGVLTALRQGSMTCRRVFGGW
jgi:hypothetical protein